MLAARDQENLVHGHQAGAASKPLNQGTRQLAPKTPGKVPKTPFKIPLNDENNAGGLGGGKGGLRTHGKGNENVIFGPKKGGLGDKDAFVTPMATRTRAPLGMKTTNAKAKAFQTPAPPPAGNDLGKTSQKSVSARKAKPRISHAEMTKLEVLGDKDVLEEREIEYMPPRAKDLPDYPDDHVELNLSMFEGENMMRGVWSHFMTREGPDGLSHAEREEQRLQKIYDIADRKMEAFMQRDIDSAPLPCTHYPECPTDICKDTVEARKAAEEQYHKTIAAIEAESAPAIKKPLTSNGPSALKSKVAAASLSLPKQSGPTLKTASKPNTAPAKLRATSALLARPKKTPPPTNPSHMRHNAAVAASKTTMGYSKGRAASATLHKTVLPKKEVKTGSNEIPDTSLAPVEYIRRYGVPRLGSEMWMRCKAVGCFDEDEGPSLEEIFAGDHPHGLDTLLREEAEQDFQLTF